MTLEDVSIIGKKILVGIAITLVPFIIIFGGLWLTQKLLSKIVKLIHPINQQNKSGIL